MHYRWLAVVLFGAAACLVGAARAATPSGPQGSHYRFAPDTNRWVGIKRNATGGAIGKLDSAGNFTPDRLYLDVNVTGPLSNVPPFTVINRPAARAYEYRSGRLIPGSIDEDGNFIPKLGGKIISFKEYRYGPNAPRIWNLPGRFIRTKDK